MGSKSREVLVPALIAASLFANRGDAPASVPVFQSVRRPAYPLTDLPSILSPKRRPSAPASTPPLRFTGCATPMRRAPSTTVGRFSTGAMAVSLVTSASLSQVAH